MKILVAISFLLICETCFSANSLERIGAIFSPTTPTKGVGKREAPEKLLPPEWRRVRNNILNMNCAKSEWALKSGKVFKVIGEGVYILEEDISGLNGYGTYIHDYRYFAVTNAQTGLVDEQFLHGTRAFPVGEINVHGFTYRVWDYGHASGPPPEVIAAAKKAAIVQKEADEKSRQASSAAALAFHLSGASNGLKSAQCSLGLRYLAGDGVPCDTNVARYWLEKSAAQDCIEAKAALKKLNGL